MIDALNIIQKGIAKGDEQKLTELYRYFHKRLLQFSKLITRSDQLSEEVVDDVFIKLWLRRDKIEEIENLTVYLYVAIKNQSLNALSKKVSELVTQPFDTLQIDIRETVGNADDLMITEEMKKKMQDAIDGLPPRCKMIFKLIREDGLKYKEVSEILNISVNTIDVQMAIAVKRICAALHITKPSRTPSFLSTSKKS